MVTIDDQMKLTQEMEAIINEYALELVINDFLKVGCLSGTSLNPKWNPLFMSLIGHYDLGLGYNDINLKFEVQNFTKSYLAGLPERKRYALRMFVMSLEEEVLYGEYESETIEGSETDSAWGRYKAELLYAKTQLDEMVSDKLEEFFVQFISEFEASSAMFSEEINDESLSDFYENLASHIKFLK